MPYGTVMRPGAVPITLPSSSTSVPFGVSSTSMVTVVGAGGGCGAGGAGSTIFAACVCGCVVGCACVDGCYATAAILALAPLVAAGLADPGDIVIVAASGTSGAGRSPSAALLATEVIGAMSAYQAGGTHRHTPEIEQALRLAGGGEPVVSFTPMLAPMPRGILATCTARLRDPGTATAALREALAAAYDGAPFVRVLPEGRWPSTAATFIDRPSSSFQRGLRDRKQRSRLQRVCPKYKVCFRSSCRCLA